MPRLVRLLSASLFAALTVSMPLTLAGCAGIPVSTLSEVSRIDILRLEPADVRVAVLFPDHIQFKKGDIVMDVGWSPKGGGAGMKGHFALEMMTGNAAAPTLARMPKPDERLFLLSLNAADAETLRAIQAAALDAKAKGNLAGGTLSVGFAGGCTRDAAMQKGPLLISAYLRARAAEAFMPLMDDLDMMTMLRQAGLNAVPLCTEGQSGPV